MIRCALINLFRAICLMLVFATGMNGVAFADHDGSHGSHCIGSNQAEVSALHGHSADQQDAAADPEANESSCVQHSCVAIVASLSVEAHVQSFASDMPTLRGDLLRASLSTESLHRPPIA